MHWDKDKLIPILIEAGQLTLDYFKKTKNTLKKDGSIVTEADIKVEAFLKEKLHSKDLFWLGEESSESIETDTFKKQIQGNGYIIDPIDGTMNYANGLEMWGISIGWIENGKYTEGAIYLPCLNEIYISDKGSVQLLTIQNFSIIDEIRLNPITKINIEDEFKIIAVTQTIVKKHTVQFSGCLQSISSAVFVLSKVLNGSYVGYIGQLKIWDIAGAIPMCKNLGIEVIDLDDVQIIDKVNINLFNLEPTSQKRFGLNNLLIFSAKGNIKKIKQDFLI